MMTILVWVGFAGLVVLLLALDLGVFHRKSRVIGPREAFAWTAFWVALAIVFAAVVNRMYENQWFGLGKVVGYELDGKQASLQFFTAYLIELSLSLDNIFVIAIIFSYFSIPLMYQHRVLFWGILGAVVMRGTFIVTGTALLHRFNWLSYPLGALLLFAALRLLTVRHEKVRPEANPFVRLTRRFFKVTTHFDGHRFLTRVNGERAVTPLFLVLVLVESTDLVFAIDSVPACLAVTWDPFLVFTSNVFAILGLRSLYFALAAAMAKFRYLKTSLVFLLAYVGIKMVLTHHVHIPTALSLAVVAGILSIGAIASILASPREAVALVSPIGNELKDLAELTWSQAKRIVIIVTGTTLLVVGGALLLLPGPGLLFLLIAVGLLATEFVWAKRLLARVKKAGEKIKNSASGYLKD